MRKFDVISPDGFSISATDTWETLEEAIDAFQKWRHNYMMQGYYSSAKFGRIPLEDLKEYCKIIEIPNENGSD